MQITESIRDVFAHTLIPGRVKHWQLVSEESKTMFDSFQVKKLVGRWLLLRLATTVVLFRKYQKTHGGNFGIFQFIGFYRSGAETVTFAIYWFRNGVKPVSGKIWGKFSEGPKRLSLKAQTAIMFGPIGQFLKIAGPNGRLLTVGPNVRYPKLRNCLGVSWHSVA